MDGEAMGERLGSNGGATWAVTAYHLEKGEPAFIRFTLWIV